MKMTRSRSQLLLIDVQQKLAPATMDGPRVIANTVRLVRYANTFAIPVTISEHCPGKIGSTVQAISVAAGAAATILEKTEFSCWRNDALRERMGTLARSGRREMVVAGMEAHVCVLQTVLDLLAADHEVFVVVDAVSSRTAADCAIATSRMRDAGAAIVTQEMVAFEWLERADTPEFRDLIGLLKS